MTTSTVVQLQPITWDGLAINPGYDPASGLTIVTEDVAGWLDSPPLDGGDIARALSDGVAYGPKILGARQIVISGVVITDGTSADLPPFRDKLAAKASARTPVVLSITDDAGRTLTATVRADSDSFKWTFLTPVAFRWQVTLTAGDPKLYDANVQGVILSNTAGGGGWGYLRTYPRTYPLSSLASTAWLANAGNAETTVLALYSGPLTSGVRLTDGTNSIFLAALGPGEQVYVDTARLVAAAPGGASRASYIQPGSAPLTVLPGGEQWSLIGSGSGTVQLQWQSAYT
jgi:hypothetical protein